MRIRFKKSIVLISYSHMKIKWEKRGINMSNLSEEVSIKLTGKITLLIPELGVNLDKQLKVKKIID